MICCGEEMFCSLPKAETHLFVFSRSFFLCSITRLMGLTGFVLHVLLLELVEVIC